MTPRDWLNPSPFIEEAHEQRLRQLAERVTGHLRSAGFAVGDESGAEVKVDNLIGAPGVYLDWRADPAWTRRAAESIGTDRSDDPDVRRWREVLAVQTDALAAVVRSFGLSVRDHVHEDSDRPEVLDPAVPAEPCSWCRSWACRIPEYTELVRTDVSELVRRFARLEPTAETGPGVNWLLFEGFFRTKLLEDREELRPQGWQQAAAALDNLATWLEEYAGLPRAEIVRRRFHLFTELLLVAGPRPEFPLTDPARLLRAALDEFPGAPENAPPLWPDELHRAFPVLNLVSRAEHLFPSGPDLATYHAWWSVWHDRAGPDSRPRTVGTPIGSSELTLDAGEVVMVYEALRVLAPEDETRLLRRLWFGVDEPRVAEFRTWLGEWIVAERAYETSHSPRPPSLAIPLRYAHLVHCSLVLSTEHFVSEEEYKERAGSFREEAIALAGAVTDAVLRLPAPARLPAAVPEPAAPESSLPLTVHQARLVHTSLVHVLGRAGTSAVARLWLGVDAPEGVRLAETLVAAIASTEESGARRVPLDTDVAHPGYCALVLATRLIHSEVAYHRETDRFKHDARKAGIDIMRPLWTDSLGGR